jgi:hypoxanthine phosphoribosyltransferase
MSNFKPLSEDIEDILYDQKDIDAMLNRLGTEITNCYCDSVGKRKLILVGVLKGSFIFIADLIRKIQLPCQVLFLRASSYGSQTISSGEVKVEQFADADELKGADVLLVEDILDSGRTLKRLSDIFKGYGAHSVRICTMLDKPSRRVAPIQTDFVGYEVGDEFIVGYGLDYNEIYRNLPYIAVLKREIYS